MRSRKVPTPRVDSLESRAVPSSAPFVGPLPSAQVSPFVAPIQGTVAGHYVETTAGGTTSVALSGSGTLTPLGAVTLSGSVTNSGDGASGTITLTSSQGSVTLSLTPYVTGPVRAVDSPGPAIPGAYVYTVTSATGSYSGISGRGEVTLGLGTAASGADTIHFTSLPRIQPL